MTGMDAEVDEYLETLNLPVREAVSRLRTRILELVPEAQQTISYHMPTFTVGGRRFVHLAGWQAHFSLYPSPDDPILAAELAPYSSGRGTLKFRLDRPVPWEVLDRVILALAKGVTPAS